MKPPIDLPTINNRRWRCALRIAERFGNWSWSFEIVGPAGGVHFHVSGPHHYDNQDHWWSGLEYHSRTAGKRDEPPSHDDCWLLKQPCWHAGTSLYAAEHYLPMWFRGDFEGIFRSMIRDADSYFEDEPCLSG